MTSDQERLIQARAAAVAPDIIGSLGFCSNARPNVAVLPGPTPAEPISVYIMTPQTKDGVWPIGGHNLVRVLGGKVVSKRAFTNSCIEAESNADGVKAVGLGVTHLLDPVPTEIHAFTVHASSLPLFVSTKDGSVFELEQKDGHVT